MCIEQSERASLQDLTGKANGVRLNKKARPCSLKVHSLFKIGGWAKVSCAGNSEGGVAIEIAVKSILEPVPYQGGELFHS